MVGLIPRPDLEISEYRPIDGRPRWGVDTLIVSVGVFFTFDRKEAELFLQIWCPDLKDYFIRSGVRPNQWWDAIKMAESIGLMERK